MNGPVGVIVEWEEGDVSHRAKFDLCDTRTVYVQMPPCTTYPVQMPWASHVHVTMHSNEHLTVALDKYRR